MASLEESLNEALKRESELIRDKVRHEEEFEIQLRGLKQVLSNLLKEKLDLETQVSALKQQKAEHRPGVDEGCDTCSCQRQAADCPQSETQSQSMDKGTTDDFCEEKTSSVSSSSTVSSSTGSRRPPPTAVPPPPTGPSPLIAKLEVEIQRLSTKLADCFTELNASKKAVKRLATDKKELETRLRRNSDSLLTMKMKQEQSESERKALHELRSVHTTLTKDYSSLSGECGTLRQQLEDTQSALLEEGSECSRLRLSEAQLSGRIQEIQSQLNAVTNDRDHTAQQSSATIQTLQSQCAEKEENIAELKERVVNLEKASESQMSNLKEELSAALESLSATECEMELLRDSQKSAADATRLESKISGKKQEQLVRQLKAQLKKEVIQSQSVNGQLLMSQDTVRQLECQIERLKSVATAKTRASPTPSTMLLSSTHSSGSLLTAGFLSLSTPPPPPPPRRSSSMQSASGSRTLNATHSTSASVSETTDGSSSAEGSQCESVSMVKQITEAMSAKLQNSEEEKHKLKESVKYLQTTIQSLTDDLEKKKLMVLNLTRRIKCGALKLSPGFRSVDEALASAKAEATATVDSATAQRSCGPRGGVITDTASAPVFARSLLLADGRGETFKQMQVIYEETTLQNEMLRRDVKAMGCEVQRLMAVTRTLESADQSTAVSSIDDSLEFDDLKIVGGI